MQYTTKYSCVSYVRNSYIMIDRHKLFLIRFVEIYGNFCEAYTAWKVFVFGVFLVRISHIRTEYGDSVQMRENNDQKNCECGRFLRSDILLNIVIPFWSFNDHCSHYINTSQMIYWSNQLNGFHMIGTLIVKCAKQTQK